MEAATGTSELNPELGLTNQSQRGRLARHLKSTWAGLAFTSHKDGPHVNY